MFTDKRNAPFAELVVPKQRRLDSLDVLRGLALCGVFITHFICEFYGLAFTPVNVTPVIATPFDSMLDKVLAFILFDKPRGMFSFLFGVGFYYQLSKMNTQGSAFHSAFIKRLVVLFLFGLVHFGFFFEGDVLRYYGIIGVLLLFSHKLPPRVLLIMAFLFSMVLPCVCNFFPNHLFFGSINTPAMFAIFGQFLFGFWAARQRIFEQLSTHRTKIKRIFWVSLSLNLCFAAARVLLHQAEARQLITLSATFDKMLDLSFVIGIQLMIFAYISGILLLFLNTKWKERFRIFVPAGRMTLTNYISQSLIAILFYKLGIYELLGTFASFIVSIFLCMFQLYSSKWWLINYKAGPLESLWRSLSARSWQPWRTETASMEKTIDHQEPIRIEPVLNRGVMG